MSHSHAPVATKTEIERRPGAARPPLDARGARWLVRPLVHSWVGPNHLTTLRLLLGLAAAAAFLPGSYGFANLGALLLVLSNFADHMDGELARLSGKMSRFGHRYDLASDAAVTILLFIAIGAGVGRGLGMVAKFSALGTLAGIAVALIFYVRMRLEILAGKAATRQSSLVGFETEDVLYLMPLVTVFHALVGFLIAAAVVAPLFALWTMLEYRRAVRRVQPFVTRGVSSST